VLKKRYFSELILLCLAEIASVSIKVLLNQVLTCFGATFANKDIRKILLSYENLQ